MATKLTEAEIQETMQSYPEWQYDSEQGNITTVAQFPDFNAAVDFITIVRDLANSINHHPDVFLFDYRNVQLIITTHEVDGLSDMDFQLASMVDELFSQSVDNQQAASSAAATTDQSIVQSVLGAFADRVRGNPDAKTENKAEQKQLQPEQKPAPAPQQSVQPQAPQSTPVQTSQSQQPVAQQSSPQQPLQSKPQQTTESQQQQQQQQQPAQPPKPVSPGARAVTPPKAPPAQ